MKKIKYLGESKGRVNDCLTCEHCGDLEEGVKNFDLDGVCYCESCVTSEFTDAQIAKAIKSNRMLSFGKREATAKKFDFLMVRLSSPWNYQDVNFYVSKEDPNFQDFHLACIKQLDWKSEEYENGLKRLDYCFKDEIPSLTQESNDNYLCRGGYLSDNNLVLEIIHPSKFIIEEKKRTTYNIKEFKNFKDVIGEDFYWYCQEAKCFKLKLKEEKN